MRLDYLLKLGTKELKKNSIENSSLDAELILSNALKYKREKLLCNLDWKANKTQIRKFISDIKKRKNRQPVAYILGKKDFWKTSFLVNQNVLIPRPETELIIEYLLKTSRLNSKNNILDIGTGSGCILISLLLERKKWKGTALDISKDAINVAKSNAKMQHVLNRITFINSDIDKFLSYKYDLIVSNPPYINRFSINNLSEDIKFNEPILALDGGYNGYSKIEKVIKKSATLIKLNGKLILEINHNQALMTKKILKTNGFYINCVLKDLRGLNRCIVSTKF